MGKEREMDTNVLKTFIAVCEYSGFSAAAKELGYTQSTVSSQIKQLEKELDVRLFDRYYHKINLTEKGVLVLQQARNILKAQAKMLDSLNALKARSGCLCPVLSAADILKMIFCVFIISIRK